jgi:hypothetical protein
MYNLLKQFNNPLLFEMTMLCKMTLKDNELLWELSGVISAEELHQVNLDHQGDLRWDDLRYLIADFKNIISIDLPKEELIVVQAIDKAKAISNSYLKISSIANSNETIKLADFYGTNTSWKYGVFETLTEARS